MKTQRLFIFSSLVGLFVAGLETVRPIHRVGVIERLGKYGQFAGTDFHSIVPLIDKMYWGNTAVHGPRGLYLDSAWHPIAEI